MKIAPLANYRASLHFLIVGRPGTGKTYSLLTLPRPLLIIDAEGGLTTIVKSEQNLEQIDVVNVTDFDELEALLRSEAIDKYASIAIDTYSTLQSFHVLKRSMGANRESLPWSEWNYVLLSLKNLFYNMRKKNCILVVNIHERLDKDTFMPLLQGQSASEIFNYVDYAFRAVCVEGKYLWKIRSETEPLKFRGRMPSGDYIPQNYTSLIRYLEGKKE